MTTSTSNVPEWKLDEVKEVAKNIKDNKVIAVVNIEGLPSRQFQEIRKSLRGQVKLKVTRLNLVRRAFESSTKKKFLLELLEKVDGPTALAYTNDNPFKLYKSMERTKQPAPAKEGAISPIDIDIKKGETKFKPGPIVGDLQRVGIPAVIEGGKVIIREDKVIVHSGDVFTREVAEMLSRLDIMPLTVGLNLRAAFSDDTIFLPDALYIDEAAYLSKITQAASESFNLSIFSAYTTVDTIEPLISKVIRESRSLAIEASITTTDTINEILASAEAGALSLNAIISS